jgi:hypothetical protein
MRCCGMSPPRQINTKHDIGSGTQTIQSELAAFIFGRPKIRRIACIGPRQLGHHTGGKSAN